MDVEQLEQRVEWLDGERRKDKNSIASLEERLEALQERLIKAEKTNSELGGEVSRLKALTVRLDHVDEAIAQNRAELLKRVTETEKQAEQRDNEILSVLRAEIRSFESPLAELRKEMEAITELKRDMQARVMEENRLSRQLVEIRKTLEDLRIKEEEQSRIYRLMEDGRRQDTRRLTDVQGEVAALRKRSDEQRGRIEVMDTSLRKLENRLNELITAERERSEAQVAFQEKQALLAVERDAIWKDWQNRFAIIEKQSIEVEEQLQALDTTYLTIKRTQEAVDDLMQRVERRINEVAEIQRLAEERFRQEWTTFKADDQKRWTNYTLTQDEQRSELSRRFDRITDRVTVIEDALQEIQDLLQQVNEFNSANLAALLANLNDWVEDYNRLKGVTR